MNKQVFEIIPAMDLLDGCCVRLHQGNFERRTIFSNDPLETAKSFEAKGYRRLHLVDLDGARTGQPRHLKVLEQLAAHTVLEIDFSGGIRSLEAAQQAVQAGARWVALGSLLVKNFDLFAEWVEQLGPDLFLPGLDVRGGMLAVKGWQQQTQVSVFDFLRKIQTLGLNRAFVTSIERDGTMMGPDTELYSQLLDHLPDFHLIASGGVRTQHDLNVLESLGCSGAIVGKALYEGAI